MADSRRSSRLLCMRLLPFACPGAIFAWLACLAFAACLALGACNPPHHTTTTIGPGGKNIIQGEYETLGTTLLQKRMRLDEARQQACGKHVEKNRVTESGDDRPGDAEPDHHRERERHPVEGHRPAFPLLRGGVRHEGHRTRPDESAPEAVAHSHQGEQQRRRRERIEEQRSGIPEQPHLEGQFAPEAMLWTK